MKTKHRINSSFLSLLLQILIFLLIHQAKCSSHSQQSFLKLDPLKLKRAQVIQRIDPEYCSVTIDSYQLYRHWEQFGIENETLAILTKNLYPAYIRIGGNAGDAIIFDMQNDELSGKYIKSESELNLQKDLSQLQPIPFVNVTKNDILKLVTFVKNTSLPLIFGLNVLYRTKSNAWDPINAKSMWNVMSDANFSAFGWELGNEPDRYRHHNISGVGPGRIANDLIKLRKEVRKFWGKQPRIIGPDVTKPSKSHRFLEKYSQLLQNKNRTVDKLSFHHYYFDGSIAKLEDFINSTIMDSLKNEILTVNEIRKKFNQEKASLWIGETASGYGGGVPAISNTFAGSFLYLDKLGLAAQLGVKVVFRQTLYSRTAWYGLIDRNGNPTPDYFVTMIFKRLIGQKVLNPHLFLKGTMENSQIRIYSHCSKYENGSVVLYGMDLSNTTMRVEIPGSVGLKILEFKLIPKDRNILSTESYMNGNLVELAKDHTLPHLEPVERKNTFEIDGYSLGFWILPSAKVRVCLRKNSIGNDHS